MSKLSNFLSRWWPRRHLSAKVLRSYESVVVVSSMSAVPEHPASKIYLVRRDGVDRRLVFACPCGVAHRIDVNLMATVQPCWSVVLRGKRVSLRPSVDVDREDCQAH